MPPISENEAVNQQNPVHMQVNVAAAEGTNATVNVSVAAMPEPMIFVDVHAGNEDSDAEDEEEPSSQDDTSTRSYHVTSGNDTVDEFDIITEDIPEPPPKVQKAPPAPEGHNFKLRRTKTLEIPDTDPKHEYEYYQVRKGDPRERDPLWFPVITHYPRKNTYANLWVKMDTGADINLIAMSTVDDLGLVDDIKPWSPIDGKNIEEIGGNKFAVCGSVTLSFIAGHRKRPFTAEFLVPTDRPDIDTNTDGLPNVLVGWRFLLENHLLMVDVDYHNDEDEQYETLALHAWEERDKGVLKACPLLRPNAPGASGHGTRGGSVKIRPNAAGYVR